MLKADHVDITLDLLHNIAKVDEFKGYWRGQPSFDPAVASYLESEARQLDSKSILAISGYELTDEDILNLNPRSNHEHHAGESIRLGAGIRDALAEVSKSVTSTIWTERYVQRLHKLLVAHMENAEGHAGRYWANSYTRGMYDAENRLIAEETITESIAVKEVQMASLINWLQQQNEGHPMHPILVAAIVWAAVVGSRPFKIGNEPLSAVLATAILTRAGYSFLRYESLANQLYTENDGYRRALKSAADSAWTDTPNWDTWLAFFAKAIEELTKRLTVKVEFAEKALAEKPIVAQEILQLLRERGRATITDVVQMTGQNRNTVKHHLHILKASAKVRLIGAGRGAFYLPPEPQS